MTLEESDTNLPWASIIIVGLNIGGYVFPRVSTKLGNMLADPTTGIPMARVCVGPNALRNGRLYTLFTASFVHDDLQHIIYNVGWMIGYIVVLESLVGFWGLFVLYLISGMIGWCLSLFDTYYSYGEYGLDVTSCGASPCTYAMSVFLLATCPETSLGTITPMVGVILSLILTMYELKCATYKHKWRSPKQYSAIIHAAYAALCCVYYCRKTFLGEAVQVRVWVLLYLLSNTISYGINGGGGSDLCCHFGGAIGGVLLAIYYFRLDVVLSFPHGFTWVGTILYLLGLRFSTRISAIAFTILMLFSIEL
eukprot:m.97712 g.97712  ORF g.97712 m.97712 type:complete len:308 (-) comp13610_c0_seq3:871-1794(-)